MAAFTHYVNGRWAAIVRRKGSHPQCKVFATHSDAKRRANQIESAIDRRVFVDRTECERTTVADLIDRYLSEVTPKKKYARPGKQRLNALKTRLNSSTANSNFASFNSGAKQCPVRPATK